jgi:hypothetical protein
MHELRATTLVSPRFSLLSFPLVVIKYSVQANGSVLLHLHAVARIQLVDEEAVLDARRSLLRELVDGVLKLVA